jgi:glycogen(starch) synthase
MRVLQLGPYPPPHGGVQTNLVAIRTYLCKNGIPCSVVNITRHRKPDADDVYYPENALELLRLLVKLRYDIIHLHVGGMLTRRVLALGLVCTLMPAKSVLTFHSGGYPSTAIGKATGSGSFAGIVLRRFNRVIGVNPEITAFLQKLAVPEDRIRLIYPYAFLAEEAPFGSLPTPLDSFYSAHRPILISVGLLEPEYDLPLQIEVFRHIRSKLSDAGLVIIGSGSLQQDLDERIRAQPYAEHILLCGDVPRSTTMAAIARADLMLRTTLYDGDAVSVREALYLGTPVIAADNGMRPAGVHLIPKHDLGALETAINSVLDAAPASGHVQSTPDESNLQAVLKVYEELVGMSRMPKKSPG